MRLSQFNPSPGWLTPLNDSPCSSLDLSLSLFRQHNSPSAYNMGRERKIQLTRRMIAPGVIYILTGAPELRAFPPICWKPVVELSMNFALFSRYGKIQLPIRIQWNTPRWRWRRKKITRQYFNELFLRGFIFAQHAKRGRQSRFAVINRQTVFSRGARSRPIKRALNEKI